MKPRVVRKSLPATTEAGWECLTLSELSTMGRWVGGSGSSPIPGRSYLEDLVDGGPPIVAAALHTTEGTSPPVPWL